MANRTSTSHIEQPPVQAVSPNNRRPPPSIKPKQFAPPLVRGLRSPTPIVVLLRMWWRVFLLLSTHKEFTYEKTSVMATPPGKEMQEKPKQFAPPPPWSFKSVVPPPPGIIMIYPNHVKGLVRLPGSAFSHPSTESFITTTNGRC